MIYVVVSLSRLQLSSGVTHLFVVVIDALQLVNFGNPPPGLLASCLWYQPAQKTNCTVFDATECSMVSSFTFSLLLEERSRCFKNKNRQEGRKACHNSSRPPQALHHTTPDSRAFVFTQYNLSFEPPVLTQTKYPVHPRTASHLAPTVYLPTDKRRVPRR
jgi:hypothetical protein